MKTYINSKVGELEKMIISGNVQRENLKEFIEIIMDEKGGACADIMCVTDDICIDDNEPDCRENPEECSIYQTIKYAIPKMKKSNRGCIY